MSMRSHVKRNSKKALNGNYSKSVIISMFIFFIFTFLTLLQKLLYSIFGISAYSEILSKGAFNAVIGITAGISVLALLFFSPLYIGVKKWYYEIACGNENPVNSIFAFFLEVKSFFKSILLCVNIVFRTLIISFLIYFVPLGLFIISRSMSGMEGNNMITVEAGLLVMSVLLFIICALLSFYVNLRYFPAIYIYIENPSMKINEILKLSIKIMRENGKKSEVFRLYASFFPFYLLSVLIVPLLLFIPYIGTASAIYAKYYIEKHRISENNKANNSNNSGEFKTISFDSDLI